VFRVYGLWWTRSSCGRNLGFRSDGKQFWCSVLVGIQDLPRVHALLLLLLFFDANAADFLCLKDLGGLESWFSCRVGVMDDLCLCISVLNRNSQMFVFQGFEPCITLRERNFCSRSLCSGSKEIIILGALHSRIHVSDIFFSTGI
jgi:hypothetical protein